MQNRTEKSKSDRKLVRGDVGATEIQTYSSSIIKLLKRLNFKQTDIARVLGKSPSFVSHVNRNRRGLTIADLETIERETGLPVFWLLLEATSEAAIPKDLRSVYEAAKIFFNYTTMAKIVAKSALE